MFSACGVATAQPVVTVTGGSDISGHIYTWSIVHDHDSPLIYFEIPHYRADVFDPIDGWEPEFINKNSMGNKPGKCIGRSGVGLAAGVPLTVNIRINPTGAMTGRGHMIFKFADGQTVRVAAEVPVKETALHEKGSLIAMSVFFAIFLLYQWRQNRRKRKRVATPPPGVG